MEGAALFGGRVMWRAGTVITLRNETTTARSVTLEAPDWPGVTSRLVVCAPSKKRRFKLIAGGSGIVPACHASLAYVGGTALRKARQRVFLDIRGVGET